MTAAALFRGRMSAKEVVEQMFSVQNKNTSLYVVSPNYIKTVPSQPLSWWRHLLWYGDIVHLKVREEYPCHIMETFSITPSPKVTDTAVEPLMQCCLSIYEHRLLMFVFEYYGELEVTGDFGPRCSAGISLWFPLV